MNGDDIDDRWLDAPLRRQEEYDLGLEEDPDEEADDPANDDDDIDGWIDDFEDC